MYLRTTNTTQLLVKLMQPIFRAYPTKSTDILVDDDEGEVVMHYQMISALFQGLASQHPFISSPTIKTVARCSLLDSKLSKPFVT